MTSILVGVAVPPNFRNPRTKLTTLLAEFNVEVVALLVGIVIYWSDYTTRPSKVVSL